MTETLDTCLVPESGEYVGPVDVVVTSLEASASEEEGQSDVEVGNTTVGEMIIQQGHWQRTCRED